MTVDPKISSRRHIDINTMTNLHTQKPCRKMMIMEEAGGMGRREEAERRREEGGGRRDGGRGER